jgi:hypothetical protein
VRARAGHGATRFVPVTRNDHEGLVTEPTGAGPAAGAATVGRVPAVAGLVPAVAGRVPAVVLRPGRGPAVWPAVWSAFWRA